MAVAEPVVITTSEARKGTERTLTFPDTGKQIVLTIPKGIRDGQQIRIVYYGNTFLIPIQVIEDPDKKSLKETLLSLPLIGLWICFCLFLLFYVMPFGYITISAFFTDDSEYAVNLLKYNLTHFPGSEGPNVRCLTGDLNTPQAQQIKQRALLIGQQLEQQHGYDLTSNTLISVVPSLGPHSGMAHMTALRGENCIQLAINQRGSILQTIRHEWAHIAGGSAHGPEWQRIAKLFGADPHRYDHCLADDYDCLPVD